MPCVHCVRRLANDPEWKCHDALREWFQAVIVEHSQQPTRQQLTLCCGV